MSHCPTLFGLGEVRIVNSSSDFSDDHTQFQNKYVQLQNGCLKWYEDEHKSRCSGVGFLISPAQRIEVDQGTKVTILRTQIAQKAGISNFDLKLKGGVLWQQAIDYNYNRHLQQMSSLPSYAFELDSARPLTEYNVSTAVKVPLDCSVYDLNLSVTDDLNELVESLLAKAAGNHQSKSSYELRTEATQALLKEHNKLVIELIRRYHNLEKEDTRLQMEVIGLECRALEAEQHANVLNQSLSNIETYLPYLTSIASSSAGNNQRQLFDQSYQESSEVKNGFMGDNRAPISWRAKHDQLSQQLTQALEALEASKLENSRLKKLSSWTNISQLKEENQRLRELTAQMRGNILKLQDQIEEIQTSARFESAETATTAVAAAAAAAVAGAGRDTDTAAYGAHQASFDIDSTMTLFPSEYAPPDGEHSQQQQSLGERWSSKYSKLLVREDGEADGILSEVVDALGWPLCEERILTQIFNHYSGDPKAGMSLTRFFRFAKEFQISQGDKRSEGSAEMLIYGEVSTIFANASKVETADAIKKSDVFKVRYGSATLNKSKSEASSFNPNSAVLSRNQFLIAVEALADRLFSRSLRQVSGFDTAVLAGREKREATRTMLELMWIKILAPLAISLDLVPWALVSLQHFLASVPAPVVSSIVVRNAPFLIEFFRCYSTGPDDAPDFYTANPLPPLAGAVDFLSDALSHRRVSFRDLSKLCMSHGLIPYLIGEPQVYAIYTELTNMKRSQSEYEQRFPILQLPQPVLSALVMADRKYTHSKVLEYDASMWIQRASSPMRSQSPQHSSNRALMSGSHNAKLQSQSQAHLLDIISFIVVVGSLAMQVFPHLPAESRLDNLIGLLHQNSGKASSKKMFL